MDRSRSLTKLIARGGRIKMHGVTLSVIIPAYNEGSTIAEVVRRVAAIPLPVEIIVVDDGSTDSTPSVLERMRIEYPNLVVVTHARNRGKGAAIRSGIEVASGDVIIIQDADLEYNPSEIPSVIRPILQGAARVAYGTRFHSGRPHGMRLPNWIINRLLAWMANFLFRASITDEATCYKAFRADLLKSIPLKCERFEFCPEVTAKVRKRGECIAEVPISYTARTIQEGKKIRWTDGIEAIWTLIKYRFIG